MSECEHIIFDLGGVIEQIDPGQVIDKLKASGMLFPEDFFSLAGQSFLCDDLEKGKCSSNEFVYLLGLELNADVSNLEILDIWNGNLLGVTQATFDVIAEIKARNIPMSILSNTNVIHFEYIKKKFFEAYQIEFISMFEHVFLSCDLGVRKPSMDLSQYIMKKIMSTAEKTIYIDDLEQNCLPFKDMGVHTINHITNKPLNYLLDFLN